MSFACLYLSICTDVKLFIDKCCDMNGMRLMLVHLATNVIRKDLVCLDSNKCDSIWKVDGSWSLCHFPSFSIRFDHFVLEIIEFWNSSNWLALVLGLANIVGSQPVFKVFSLHFATCILSFVPIFVFQFAQRSEGFISYVQLFRTDFRLSLHLQIATVQSSNVVWIFLLKRYVNIHKLNLCFQEFSSLFFSSSP